jgi:hypothetical protein
MKVIDELVKLAEGYLGDDYYVHGEIPPKKLEASTKYHGVDPRDTVIVLLDATITGSADNGMSITLKGVYWKNAWHTKTRKNHYTWEELKDFFDSIYVKSGSLIFEQGVLFSTPANYSNDSLVNVIKTFARFFIETTQGANVLPDINNAAPSRKETALIENNAPEIYEILVPEVIALCISADGEIEDSEIELATDIIESDELIGDKQLAMESLSSNIEKFISGKSKSSAIFKLKYKTTISKVSKITDEQQKERLSIILEGMLESVGDNGTSETKSIIDEINAKLNG